ncbi:hypothetical protein PN456_17270 [Nodularia spumigena CS-586/05]|nr:hypothetical protein [Nodularia spumigena]MDB9370675.1 hypothetical protein [Nodularia spumigena CS-586/05]
MINDIDLPDEDKKISIVDTILNIDGQDNSTNSETYENIEIEDEDPAENITKHNLTNSPYSKLGVVGFFFGTGFFVVFLFFSGVSNRNFQSKNEEIPAQIPEETLARIENNNGDIFAQAALGKQENELRKINQKPTVIPEESEDNQETIPERRTQRETTTAPNPSSPPAPKPVNRSVQREVSSPVRPLPPSTSQARNVSVPPAPLPSIATSPALDPMTELNRLRNVGSFGNIAYANHTTPRLSTQEGKITKIDNSNAAQTTASDRTERSDVGNRQNSGKTATTRERIERIEPRWQPNQGSKQAQNRETTRDVKIASVNYLPQEAQIIH